VVLPSAFILLPWLFCYHHAGGPKGPAMQCVASGEGLDDGVGLCAGLFDLHERFVAVGVEGFASLRIDYFDRLLAEFCEHLIVHQAKAFKHSGGIALGRINGQGTLKIIDDRNQATDERLIGVLNGLLLFRLKALAHVFHIRQSAHGLIALIADFAVFFIGNARGEDILRDAKIDDVVGIRSLVVFGVIGSGAHGWS